MKEEEKNKLTYLDSILLAIKELGSDRVELMEIANHMEGEDPRGIQRTLVSGGTAVLEKALVLLLKWDYISDHIDTGLRTPQRTVTLTFEGELIIAQGGLLVQRENEYKQINARTWFHMASPWISLISVLIALTSLWFALKN